MVLSPRLIEAAKRLHKTQVETMTYLAARGGSYGSSRMILVDRETGEEYNYEEVLAAAEGSGIDVSTHESEG